MTDNPTTDDNLDPEQPAAEDPAAIEDQDQIDAEETDDEPAGSEAAKYRLRLRATEAERDDLATKVEALQRQQAEALLARERMTPAALWATTELADVLGDDGLVDPEKVRAAAATAREELGIGNGLYVPAEGKIPNPASGNQFRSAFTPPTR